MAALEAVLRRGAGATGGGAREGNKAGGGRDGERCTIRARVGAFKRGQLGATPRTCEGASSFVTSVATRAPSFMPYSTIVTLASVPCGRN